MICRNLLKGILFAWGVFVPLIAFAQEPLESIPIESVQLLKISGSDERAVIKTPDGKLVVIKVGDAIGNQNGKITEIAAGRIVVEEKVGREIETIIFRLDEGKQRIERIKRFGEEHLTRRIEDGAEHYVGIFKHSEREE